MNGNIYLTGIFTMTANFGGADLISSGDRDIFIAKYDSSGVHQWSDSFGSSAFEEPIDIAVNSTGNIYLAGKYNNSIDLNGHILTNA